MKYLYSSNRKCPTCYGEVWRINKTTTDKLVNVLIPIGRYKCMGCLWEGVLIRSRSGSKVKFS
jgi:hypothetical protein